MSSRILIVDDDAGFANVLSRLLSLRGHDVTAYSTAEEARRVLPSSDADVVVVDWQLPDADGLSLIDELRGTGSGAVFLMATAFPELEIAVEAMRRGAFDYVPKGSEIEECVMRIERAADVALLRRRMAEASRATAEGDAAAAGLVGDSPVMQALRERLDALASSDDTTVLIIGETGTGKGVVARYIHGRSGRAYEPFVAVDCTTIPATLMESELFGHEKGSFSGAIGSKMGRVEAAGRGTLFLDEIGELPLAMQAKLLRLLEEREYTRVGSTRARDVRARIITATNRRLEHEVQEGRFRADLRYRLEVFVVEMPPLRRRGDDVFLLAAHFAAERARALGRPEPRLHPTVVELIPQYRFPGNVRELRNMVEQAVVLAKGDELTLDEFPVLSRMVAGGDSDLAEVRSSVPSSPADDVDAELISPIARPPASRKTVDRARTRSMTTPETRVETSEASLSVIRQRAQDAERHAIVTALEQAKGNVAAAARELGLSRYQLLRRLTKYDLR